MKSNTKLLTCALAIAIAVAFLVTMVPVTAEAQNIDSPNGEMKTKEWNCSGDGADVKAMLNLTTKQMIITGHGKMKDYGPGDSEKAPWLTDEECKDNIKGLVILSHDVESIGNYAFAEIKTLSAVELSHVVTIGDHAFYKSGLKTVTIPNYVQKVGAGAFEGLAALEGIEIGYAVHGIDQDAFGSMNFTGIEKTEYNDKLPGLTFETVDFHNYIVTTDHIVTVAALGNGLLTVSKDPAQKVSVPMFTCMVSDNTMITGGPTDTVITIVCLYGESNIDILANSGVDTTDTQFKDWEGLPTDGTIEDATTILAHFETQSSSSSSFPVWAIVVIIVVIVAIVAIAVYYMRKNNA